MPGHLDPVPRHVVAWGRSVLASALAAGLAPKAGLEVVQVDATLPAVLDALQLGRAHAVVCDLASVPAACILALLAAHPHLVVLIVDPDADRALALTCRRPPMRTIDDLVAAVLAGSGEDPDRRRQVQDWPTPVPPCPPHFLRGQFARGPLRRRLWVMAATARRRGSQRADAPPHAASKGPT